MRLPTWLIGLPNKTQTCDSNDPGRYGTWRKLYQQRCVQCDGDNAEGNRKLKSSALDKLEGCYLIELMRKLRAGERSYHPQDEWGRVMGCIQGNDRL